MVAQRIRASVAAEPVSLGGGERVDVTVSIGVAALSDFARDNAIEGVAQELVASADAALYQAKAGGRNKVVTFA
jgi:diguanylate cyclase (GGDEF)-like protein